VDDLPGVLEIEPYVGVDLVLRPDAHELEGHGPDDDRDQDQAGRERVSRHPHRQVLGGPSGSDPSTSWARAAPLVAGAVLPRASAMMFAAAGI
jgi:hypothetical protein